MRRKLLFRICSPAIRSPSRKRGVQGLLTRHGHLPVRTSDEAKPLKLPSDIKHWDAPEKQAPVAKAIQAAILNSFSEPEWRYSNETGRYTLPDGEERPSGIPKPHDRRALDALLGENHFYRKEPDEAWFRKLSTDQESGVYTVLRWGTDPRRQPVYHAVSVLRYASELDRVIFRNPQIQHDTEDGNDIDNSGPNRRAWNSRQGLETMTLREFVKRVQYALPSQRMLDFIEHGITPTFQTIEVPKCVAPEVRKPSLLMWGLLGTVGGLSSVMGFTMLQSFRSGGESAATAPGAALEEAAAASPRVPPGAAMSEEILRESLPGQFLGVKEWEMLFSERVMAAEKLPASLSRELLASDCPISKSGNIASSHQAILVPEGLTLSRLKELCKAQGITLKFGRAELSDDPELNSRNEKSYWALTVDPKSIPDAFKSAFSSRDRGSLPGVLRARYPNYKVNTVQEAVLSILMSEIDPTQLCPSMTVLCSSRDSSGQQLFIKYEPRGRTIMIDLGASFYTKQVSVSPGFNLK